MKYKFPAFTLVELIVVITIIGILSTVWFVSYSNYLTWARDSNRYSQLTKLSDSLQVYATTKSLPLPDYYIEITASWATNVIAYQGYVGTDVLETIDYTNGGKDPKDDSFYTYYLTKDRKSLQLMALMEEAGSVTQNTISNTTFAADYSSRFPKVYGKKLWVLTEVDTNTPVQELSSILSGSWYLDIVKTSKEYNSYISNDLVVTWSWTKIAWIEFLNKYWSKNIKLSKDGGIVFSSIWRWNYLNENEKCIDIVLFSEEELSLMKEIFTSWFKDYIIETDLEFYYKGDDSTPKHYIYWKKMIDFSDYNLHLNFNAGDNTVMKLSETTFDTITCTTSNAGRCWTNWLPLTDSEPILLYKLLLQPRCDGATAFWDNWSRNSYSFKGTYYSVELKK